MRLRVFVGAESPPHQTGETNSAARGTGQRVLGAEKPHLLRFPFACRRPAASAGPGLAGWLARPSLPCSPSPSSWPACRPPPPRRPTGQVRDARASRRKPQFLVPFAAPETLTAFPPLSRRRCSSGITTTRDGGAHGHRAGHAGEGGRGQGKQRAVRRPRVEKRRLFSDGSFLGRGLSPARRSRRRT